ncbi:MAG: hypothetical protein ACLP05_10490 [Candidatus Kryptoniota bacterium]
MTELSLLLIVNGIKTEYSFSQHHHKDLNPGTRQMVPWKSWINSVMCATSLRAALELSTVFQNSSSPSNVYAHIKLLPAVS